MFLNFDRQLHIRSRFLCTSAIVPVTRNTHSKSSLSLPSQIPVSLNRPHSKPFNSDRIRSFKPVTKLVVCKEHINLKLNFEMEAAGQASQTKIMSSRMWAFGYTQLQQFSKQISNYTWLNKDTLYEAFRLASTMLLHPCIRQESKILCMHWFHGFFRFRLLNPLKCFYDVFNFELQKSELLLSNLKLYVCF